MVNTLDKEIKWLPAGDKGLVVEFGNVIDPDINRRVHDLAQSIIDSDLIGISYIVPTYRSLLVEYDPMNQGFDELVKALKSLLDGLKEGKTIAPKLVEIPVIYGGEYGPDLDFVCESSKLSSDQVIDIHSSANYLVYMLGFTPGFPYLGGMDERIATPRLKTPRTSIPAGSVGIAEKQTGVYPIESPGGWQLIGYTPVNLFDLAREKPVLLEPGNYVRFIPVEESIGKKIRVKVTEGTYEVKISDFTP